MLKAGLGCQKNEPKAFSLFQKALKLLASLEGLNYYVSSGCELKSVFLIGSIREKELKRIKKKLLIVLLAL